MRIFNITPWLLNTMSAVLYLGFTTCRCEAQQQKTPLPFAEHRFLERPVRMVAHQRSLPDILDNLAASAHVDFLTDGLPQRKVVNLEVRGTMREALDQIASSFDCSWSVSRSGIVLISRRFIDPAEHPQIHLKEMQQMVRDIHMALQIVPPEVFKWDYNSGLNELAASFTPEQRVAAENDSLNGSDLNPEQFGCLNLAILNHAFAQRVISFEALMPLTEGISKSTVQIKPPSIPVPGNNQTPADPPSAVECLYSVRDGSGRRITYFMVNGSIITGGAVR